jgi:hypothetical protein
MSIFNLSFTILILALFFFKFYDSLGQNSMGFELQRTFERVDMINHEDFVLGNSMFLLTHDHTQYTYSYGLEIQEALLGQFGGLYVFGLTTEFDYDLSILPIALNVNTFIGGGGGAGAPDGSGLAYRYGCGIKFILNPNINFLLRYSNYNFPTGSIGGKQIQWGLSYKVSPSTKQYPLDVLMAKQSASIQNTFMLLDANDAASIRSRYHAKLVGVEYAAHYNKRIAGLIRLQGAISRKIDGFMAYYTGLSMKIISTDAVTWNAKTLIGSCGGGGMNTSGGLAYILETGVDFKFPRKAVSISRGFNTSHAGSFAANYINIGLKYDFESSFLIGAKGQFRRPLDELRSTFLGLRTGLNLHKAPNAADKNGLLYTDMTLMYFGLSYPIGSHFELLGETRWAMGGDYGAYAEGVFGISSIIFDDKKFKIKIPIHAVIAGGGGIDVGKGVGIQLNLSLNYMLSENTQLRFSVGRLDMLDGNYDPVSIHLSIHRNLLIHHN